MDQLCTPRRLAWVIDRRLDRDQLLSCELLESPLSEFLPQVLESIAADAVVVGSTVIVGPHESIRWLRTLVEIQRTELSKSGATPQQVSALGRALDLHWDDLAEPAQLVKEVTQRIKLDVTGAASIPYDLWGSGQLVGVTAGEALTVLAWQYDLQFRWEPGGKAALVPLKVPVQISRVVPLAESRREAAKSQFPDLTWEPEGKSLRLTGRVEELEALDQWIKGGAKPRPTPKGPVDWRTRKFTLTVKNSPLLDLLRALKQQGIPLTWDEPALTTAGVDLTQKINLDLTDASPDGLL